MLKERLKTLRKAKGWTQKELAAHARVSQQAIWKIESGKSHETRKLPQIAAALGVTAEELSDRRPDQRAKRTDSGLSSREWRLLEAFREAEGSVKRAIEGAAGLSPFLEPPPSSTKPIRPKSQRITTY
jgi:transcriptional regulator with XRE-family HTH domain